MHIFDNPMIMRQIIMDHYDNPQNKREPKDDRYLSLHMHSDNCIDDINVYLKIENDKVVDACFTGVACTISTSSTDIMCDLLVGKSKDEALKIIEQYHHMIHEEEFDFDLLGEAVAFKNTSKQAARIRCATIGWDAADKMIKENK